MFVASALPDDRSPSGWACMLPERLPKAALTHNISADIIIVGAGFAGLAAACRLHQIDKTLRIVLLEALAVGDGAAGRNSGFLIDLPHDVSSESYGSDSDEKSRNEIYANRTAIALARAMAEEHGWGREIFDPCGKYSIALSDDGDAHLKAYSGQLDAMKEPHQSLDRQGIFSVTGAPVFSSGLYTPGAVIIQPAAYIRAFADALPSSVTLFERSPVLSMDRQSDAWLVKTAKGSVRAKRVLLTVNGHAQSFGILPKQLLHIFTYASLTEEFNPQSLGGERSWAATPAHPMGTSVRRIKGRNGDRILIRSRYTYNPEIKATEHDVARSGRIHDRKFKARFPMLHHVKMQYRWGGAMSLTWNAVPAVFEVEPGLIVAAACNGVGGTKATASGIVAAERALGVSSPLGDIYRGMTAPKKLPPAFITKLGAQANLAFRHFRAGGE